MPTILAVFGMMSTSLICLLAVYVFELHGAMKDLVMVIGIVLGSIALGVFSVAILYPFSKDVFLSYSSGKKKNASDNEIL
jgi:hypothetical protein